MTFYLESKYGKAWVENNECQYSEEEVVDGLNFIKSLEDNHVIPTRPTMIDRRRQGLPGEAGQ